ncbi:MAG: hypothetical protein M3N53_06740 [Actinomycetota bacterium]|nr:hypothetical protein [Actinomycetota bacterium]
MGKRIAVALLLTSALLTGVAPSAAGWSNGRAGPDSFGTHDWILDRAARAVASDLPWLRLRVALRATDDPDTRDGIDHASGSWWHVWDEWGSTYGGAPEAAKVWFARAARRHEAGRDRAASRAVGILAHIVGDVANPMHTDQTDTEERIHSSYEVAVDSRSEREDNVYSFSFNGRDPARPYRKTRSVARTAHRYYGELVRNYDRYGYNAAVHRITQMQLQRAANALADLLARL